MTDFFEISDVVFVVGVVGVAQTSVGPEFKLQEFVPKFALPKKDKKDMKKYQNFLFYTQNARERHVVLQLDLPTQNDFLHWIEILGSTFLLVCTLDLSSLLPFPSLWPT